MYMSICVRQEVTEENEAQTILREIIALMAKYPEARIGGQLSKQLILQETAPE